MGLVCPGGCNQDSVGPEIDNHSPTFEKSPYKSSPIAKRTVYTDSDLFDMNSTMGMNNPSVGQKRLQKKESYKSDEWTIIEDKNLDHQPSSKRPKEHFKNLETTVAGTSGE